MRSGHKQSFNCSRYCTLVGFRTEYVEWLLQLIRPVDVRFFALLRTEFTGLCKTLI